MCELEKMSVLKTKNSDILVVVTSVFILFVTKDRDSS